MKNYRILILLLAGIVVSCDDFLGDNKNPNQATAVTPQLVLPAALTTTATLVRSYNTAGSWISGYTVNAGGFGGWGSTVSYNYTTNDHAALWASTYDDLNNYQYIENSTESDPSLAYFNAVAKVMKAFCFQHLVDFYGDVPYFDALKGAANLNPKYDKGEDIYVDLVDRLDEAIDIFENATLVAPLGSADVLFGGDMVKWAQFANTLKLKLLIRVSGVSSLSTFVTSAFATFDNTLGILTDDALVNPGYLPTDGKQNPSWAFYHSNAAGTQQGQGRQAIPSDFVYSFYNGSKITDAFRGPRVFRSYPTTPTGQLGDLDSNPDAITNYIAWYVGTGSGADAANTIGLFKGRTAGQPIYLAAEAYFLLAEAYLKGFLTGSAQTAFDDGILASFRYLYKDINSAVIGDPVADVAAYKAANPTSRLVDYSLAGSAAQQLEAIITQKYIALNFIHGDEAWTEFRRTAYPAIVNGSQLATASFASILSESPRADRLPIRVLYASTEYQLNEANVPGNISQFTSLIFWQPQ